MKRKELFWMLVPCLLMLGAGVYFSRDDIHPMRVAFDKVQLLPLTPRDIADGYDARVLVRTYVKGIPHSWWRKRSWTDPSYGTDLKFQLIGTSSQQKRLLLDDTASGKRFMVSGRDLEDGFSEFLVLFKTKGLARNEERIDLKLAGHWHGYQFQSGKSYRLVDLKPLRYLQTLTLHSAGAAPSLPPIDKNYHFKLRGIGVYWLTGSSTTAPGLCVNTLLDNPTDTDGMIDSKGRQLATLRNACLTTEKGVVHFDPQMGFPNFRGGKNFTSDKNLYLSFDCSRQKIPATARNVTFNADLSINDCWPLPISVVLRKDGKNITRDVPEP